MLALLFFLLISKFIFNIESESYEKNTEYCIVSYNDDCQLRTMITTNPCPPFEYLKMPKGATLAPNRFGISIVRLVKINSKNLVYTTIDGYMK